MPWLARSPASPPSEASNYWFSFYFYPSRGTRPISFCSVRELYDDVPFTNQRGLLPSQCWPAGDIDGTNVYLSLGAALHRVVRVREFGQMGASEAEAGMAWKEKKDVASVRPTDRPSRLPNVVS